MPAKTKRHFYHANVLDWAASYTGPKFHALLCDPPYHLLDGSGKGGFMNARWDGATDGEAVAFQASTWAALAQHLLPGAFILAFASSRGAHRMAVAMEDAGLIINPTIYVRSSGELLTTQDLGWCFGCLSEDTEILTEDGWEPYHKATQGTRVLCYNVASDGFEWHGVQDAYEYQYDDTAYHIQSSHTDQLVSRNHRCIVERSGAYIFQFAETLQPSEVVPIVEGMPTLRAALRIAGDTRTAILLGELWGLGARRTNAQATRGDNHLSSMRHAKIYSPSVAEKDKAAFLLEVMPGQDGNSTNPDSQQVQQDREAFSRDRLAWRQKSRLEGRRYLFQKARQLCSGEIRSLSCRVYFDGTQGWVRDGASFVGSASNRAPAYTHGGRASYRSQSNQQCAIESDAVCIEPRSQALRASWRTSADLATVTPMHYQGIVWCVKVPTGAFVARRNGKVFVTGNSGFPKATRLDVAIDRRAGATRRKVGTKKHQPKFDAAELGYRQKDNGFNSHDRETFDVTAPATGLAAQWAGHRYGGQALKPALEPIVVAQVPYLPGAALDSILVTGAGAWNIADGRIGDEGGEWNGAASGGYMGGFGAAEMDGLERTGRWPAHLLLQHTPACTEAGCYTGCPIPALDAQSGYSISKPHKAKNAGSILMGYRSGIAKTDDWTSYSDAGGASRYFQHVDWQAEVGERLALVDPAIYVPKCGSAEREAGLEALEQTTVGDGRKKAIDNAYQRGETPRRNTHPTIKPLRLTTYLTSLLLPPAGIGPRRILVPFAGTGSEGIGAMKAGWDEVTMIEMTDEYVPLNAARWAYWEQNDLPPALPREAADDGGDDDPQLAFDL